jgi:hypothetical protein
MHTTLPMVMGGDFNLIRHYSDKNNKNVNQDLMDVFNMFIHQLQEIKWSGIRYTWTNKQKHPIMVALDRIWLLVIGKQGILCVLHGAKQE